MSKIEKSPARARSGAFSLGGDRRVGACASGDELVSLGFRVGNPSAIGWHQPTNFPARHLDDPLHPSREGLCEYTRRCPDCSP